MSESQEQDNPTPPPSEGAPSRETPTRTSNAGSSNLPQQQPIDDQQASSPIADDTRSNAPETEDEISSSNIGQHKLSQIIPIINLPSDDDDTGFTTSESSLTTIFKDEESSSIASIPASGSTSHLNPLAIHRQKPGDPSRLSPSAAQQNHTQPQSKDLHEPHFGTQWEQVYHHLSDTIHATSSNVARTVQLFTKNPDSSTESSSSSDSGGTRVPSNISQAFRSNPENFLGKSDTDTTTRTHHAGVKMYAPPKGPFKYEERPFRLPALANICQEPLNNVSSTGDISLQYPYEFSTVNVSSEDWLNVPEGSATYLAVRRWKLGEPHQPHDRLPADKDPLVKYETERRGLDGDQVTLGDLYEIQDEIALGQTVSGRKLEGFQSSDDECMFQRVRCQDESNFDPQLIDLGDEGKWPDPYSFYWNYKRIPGGIDDDYERHSKSDKTLKMVQMLEELETNPLKIPFNRAGGKRSDNSDSDDPDPKVPRVADPENKFSLRWRLNEVRKPVTDPIERRYPYLYLHLQGKYYNKYHELKKEHRARTRRWYTAYWDWTNRLCLKSGWDECSASCCLTQRMWRNYPIWYSVWKCSIRYVVRRLPREWKFLDEKQTKTLFYGTLASIFKTQYIVEYNVFPNMDDPVATSQVALLKALEIKEKFLTFDKHGRACVGYLTMQRSKMYEDYLQWIGLLCRYHPIKMPHRVRKVFFLNFFNVLSIQTQIWRIPEVENMEFLWEMDHFWEKTKGLAGFIELNLEEIYHGILRCNQPHPMKQAQVFSEPTKGYPRELSPTRLSLDWLDPRIHFALNIGCKSCPPIHVFSLYEHDCQLEEVAKTYVRSRVTIDVDLRLVKLPILFLWYERDFGSNQRVMLWYLKRYMLAKDALKIRKLVASRKPIFFRYESFDYRLEPLVHRHPSPTCTDLNVIHRKHLPVYWGGKC